LEINLLVVKLKSKLFLWQGGVLVFLSSLPWLGLGRYTFSDISDNIWPRLEIFHIDFLYEFLSIPIRIIVELGLLDQLFLFNDGRTIKPFMVFIFYFVSGITSLLISVSIFLWQNSIKGLKSPQEK